MSDGIPLGFKPHPGDFLDKYVGKRRSAGPKHKRPPSFLSRIALAGVAMVALAPAAFLLRPVAHSEQVQAMPQWVPAVPVPVLPEVPARQGFDDRPTAHKAKPKPRTLRYTAYVVKTQPVHRSAHRPVHKPLAGVPKAPHWPETPAERPPVPAEGAGGEAGAPGLTPGGTCRVGPKFGRWVKSAAGLVCTPFPQGAHKPPSPCPTTPPNTPHTTTTNPPTTTNTPTTTKNPNGSAPTQDDHEKKRETALTTPAPQGLRPTI